MFIAKHKSQQSDKFALLYLLQSFFHDQAKNNRSKHVTRTPIILQELTESKWKVPGDPSKILTEWHIFIFRKGSPQNKLLWCLLFHKHQEEVTCIAKLSTDTAIRTSHHQCKSYLHCTIFVLMLHHQSSRWTWNTLAKIKTKKNNKNIEFPLRLSFHTKVFQNIGFAPTWVSLVHHLISFTNWYRNWYRLFSIRPVTEIFLFILHRPTKHQSWKFY